MYTITTITTIYDGNTYDIEQEQKTSTRVNNLDKALNVRDLAIKNALKDAQAYTYSNDRFDILIKCEDPMYDRFASDFCIGCSDAIDK